MPYLGVCECASWNTLLSWAVRLGQHKLVEDLGQKMATQGVEGDVTTNNIRLQYLLAERPEEGLSLYQELRTARRQDLKR